MKKLYIALLFAATFFTSCSNDDNSKETSIFKIAVAIEETTSNVTSNRSLLLMIVATRLILIV